MTNLAVCDANSYYCSVELAFRDDLRGRGVLVVGNGDRCVVSRTPVVKPFIPMGAPIYQYRQVIEHMGFVVFSSNYALYQEFSRRIHAIMARLVGDENTEEYSIDESFLVLRNIPPGEREQAMRELRTTILRETNIPVSIGVAASKVLTKLAAEEAKSLPGGVRIFADEVDIDAVLARTPTEEIWFIGKSRAKSLKDKLGIETGLQLKHADLVRIRRLLHVPVARVVCELRGIPAMPFQTIAPPRQEIVCARSFGRPVTSLRDITEAAASYTAMVTRRLWTQHSLASTLSVSVMTNRFREDQPQHHASCLVHLPRATNGLSDLIRTAQHAATQLYQPGYHYHKVAIMLADLSSDTLIQGDLFAGDPNAKEQRLLATIRAIEARFGKGAIFIAATGGPAPDWAMRQRHLSPRYTTNWRELPVAHA